MADDPQIGEWGRRIDRSIGTAEEGNVRTLKLSGPRGFDLLGDLL